MTSSERLGSLDEATTLPSVALEKSETVEIIVQNNERIVIKTQHNSIYIDPQSDCNGIVIATIEKIKRGDVEETCSGCDQTVNISATQVLIATGQLRWCIVNRNTPEEIKALSLMSGICEKIIQAWGSVLPGGSDQLLNYLKYKKQQD